MTDNTIEEVLGQMGKTYRSWKPRQERVQQTWNFLVQELEASDATMMPVVAPQFGFAWFETFFHLGVLRPVLAVLVLGIFGVGSLMRVASASLPGDTLYTVKLVREQALVRLTSDKTERAKLAVQFAVNRADEVRQVVSREGSRESKAANVAVAVLGLQEQVTTATDALAATSDKKELTGLMKEGTEQIVAFLDDAKNEAAKNNGVVAKEVNTVFAAMSETKALVELSANPPSTLSLSVAVKDGDVFAPVAPEVEKPVAVPAPKKKILGQSPALAHPAQSVFSLPVSQGMATEEDVLPIATSIQSAR